MAADLLADASWTCCRTEPGAADSPKQLGALAPRWYAAEVPGTAAGALRAAGARWDDVDYDAEDWWFRTTFDGPPEDGPFDLRLDGIATLWEVWLNGERLAESQGMFTPTSLELPELGPTNELSIGCRALGPVLAARRPRPRWRTRLVDRQTIRHVRTTLFGRIPSWAGRAAPVGPWRPVTLRAAAGRPAARLRRLSSSLEGSTGVVAVELALEAQPVQGRAWVIVEGSRAELQPAGLDEQGHPIVRATVAVPDVRPWWPHTHGDQPLYELDLLVDGARSRLARTGFRKVEVDRSGGAFDVSVNGVKIFCRGACWVPVDPVTMVAPPDVVRASLEQLRSANLNLVRVTGTMVYEDASFFDACDELGLLVWQDCMLANLEPPEDAEFAVQLEGELDHAFELLAGRPSIAVVSGGSEIEQQA
ncbi:MAG TPA: hypothetical protein VGL60_08800, partial [Acidimicrobiales bacterium]